MSEISRPRNNNGPALRAVIRAGVALEDFKGNLVFSQRLSKGKAAQSGTNNENARTRKHSYE